MGAAQAQGVSWSADAAWLNVGSKLLSHTCRKDASRSAFEADELYQNAREKRDQTSGSE
jgi:hypothetical protein